MATCTDSNNVTKQLGSITSMNKIDKCYKIEYKTGESAQLSILNSHVIRFYMSPTGEFLDYPKPNDPSHKAKINSKPVSDYGLQAFKKSSLEDNGSNYLVKTDKIQISFDKLKGTMTVLTDKGTLKEIIKEVNPLSYNNTKTTQELRQNDYEYFYGGGMQNGRFSHKGERIQIVNTNKWTDGGVTSPCPFYWSTMGYGVLRNTWQPGEYDFTHASKVKTTHNDNYFDAFYFVNFSPDNILRDYFELTGSPLFMPEYAFYEAHLDAFNRDYWVKVDPSVAGAILFEDGCYYKSYKPDAIGDKKGILESLNGEKDNYQFSARAMIDRYKMHNMPLGWFIPNDGYGAGYGQTDSLQGDVDNLKEFAIYARENGVEVALWTESNLEPIDPSNPKKGDRDLRKEVDEAGVVALKADVAWIGSGYSAALSAIEHAVNIFTDTTKGNVRAMTIMVDGWAGTQRYAGLWSGDQYGGQWEYIRFHIPTYIGSGLSGQPIVGSDMDGIYGGKDRHVNIRDFQWKTFTPLQLNMDGWGSKRKTPFTFDEEATSINRAYLKLKSMLMPYNYTISHESISGLPMIRAMFLEFPKDMPAYTLDSQYQFMWGPNLLIAPIYNDKESSGHSLRNGIYLPDLNQVWIDFFTGQKYQGGRVLNEMEVPLWKIPVFIKDGAIIPWVNPNNNPNQIQRGTRIISIYPNGTTKFTVYEDDGISCDYINNSNAKTTIEVRGPKSNETGDLFITINATKGDYKGMVHKRFTIINIMSSKNIEHIKVGLNDANIHLDEAKTKEEFDKMENVYFFDEKFTVNSYLEELAGNEIYQSFISIKLQKIDISDTTIQIKIKDYQNISKIFGNNLTEDPELETPNSLTADNAKTTSSRITLNWESVEDTDYYEIERDGVLFSHIDKASTQFEFENFKPETSHQFKIRSLKDDRVSLWSEYITEKTLKV